VSSGRFRTQPETTLAVSPVLAVLAVASLVVQTCKVRLRRTNSRGREDASPVILQMEQSVLDRVTQHALATATIKRNMLQLCLFSSKIKRNLLWNTTLPLFIKTKNKKLKHIWPCGSGVWLSSLHILITKWTQWTTSFCFHFKNMKHYWFLLIFNKKRQELILFYCSYSEDHVKN